MFHLNESFRSKMSPAKWRNKVSAFLNNLCGSGPIEVERPDDPSVSNPPIIRLNMEKLKGALAIPQNVMPHIFQLRVVEVDQRVDRIEIYLPNRTMALLSNGASVYVSVNTIKDQTDDGWWTLYANGSSKVTSGAIWLVEDKDSNGNVFLKYSATKLADTSKISLYIGEYSSGVLKQNGSAIMNHVSFKGSATENTTYASNAIPSGNDNAEVWTRSSATTNLILDVFVATKDNTDTEPYKTKLYPMRMKFDLDGRLVSLTNKKGAAAELTAYQFVREL